MKKIIVLLLLLVIQTPAISKGYDMTVPVTGDCIADDKLQFLVTDDIYKKLSKKFPDCFDYSITDTQIIKYPYDTRQKNGRYIKGYWDELWTVNACGAKVQIPVSFELTTKDAVFYVNPELFSKYSLKFKQ